MSTITKINVGGVDYDIGGAEYTAGSGISISNGELSIKIDGTTLVVDTNGVLSAVGGAGSSANAGTKVVTVGEGNNAKTSLQAVTNLTPTYTGNTRGNGAVDLQQYRDSNTLVASGAYSVAMGSNNTAGGDYSIAMGYNNIASNYYSVSIGYYNTASGASSVALGYNNTASDESSVAMGYNNIASGYSSVAMGYWNRASSYYSVAMGCGSSTGGYSSVAMGYNNTSSGDYSVAIGCWNIASGDCSVAMGYDNTARGDYSTVFGTKNVAKAKYSVVTGSCNKSQIVGAVTNNNVSAGDTSLANIYNPYGHSGFKGLNVSDSVVELFKLSNTDQLVARIDVLSFNLDPVSFFITVAAAEVKYCNIQGNHTVFNESDIYMSNGNLYLYTHTWDIKQIGIFYTLYSYTNALSSSSSSSSSM